MRAAICRRACALLALAAVIVPSLAAAKDRRIDRDWRTGVTVAPGASTWTDQNFEQKKAVIGETAAAESRICSHYAFLNWPPESGTVDTLMAETRRSYEAQGFAVREKPGANPGDTVWTVAKDGLEAVVLWGTVSGSAVYLSCLTAGTPAPDPDKPFVVGAFLAAGLGSLLVGVLLYRRARTFGQASLSWPKAPGTIKSSEVVRYRTHGGAQFMARVVYDYRAKGRAYVGDRLRFGAYAAARAAAEHDAARYRPGTAVEVRYDPAKPSRATLEPGTAGKSPLGIALAVVGVILVGITGLVAVLV